MSRSVLELHERGHWSLSRELTPYEYWGYTTWVEKKVLTLPRAQMDGLEHKLREMFEKEQIPVGYENKCAFGLKDEYARIWYFGFYDSSFDLGLSVRPDTSMYNERKPSRRPRSLKGTAIFKTVAVDPEGSGMEHQIPLGTILENAHRCCSNCEIIRGHIKGDPAEWAPVSFTSKELEPQNEDAKKLLELINEFVNTGRGVAHLTTKAPES